MLNRRDFIRGSASAAGLLAFAPGAFAQSLGAAAPAGTPGGKNFRNAIGEANWAALPDRLRTVNQNIRTRGLRKIPGVNSTLLTGYPYNEFYDWDLYFENLYLSYYNVWPYCFTNLQEFLDRQHPDGYINRSLIKQRDRQHFKPFLAQLVVLGCRQNGHDYSWVKGNYYDRLRKYVDKWFSYDGDGNGLPTWNSADEAGTDNQWSRGGPVGSFTIEGADLASYLVRELRALAVIANGVGRSADAKGFSDHADQLIGVMNATFWDEEAGMYYDRNEKTGKLVPVKSATSFATLFAGAATPERARRTVQEHLLNEKEFWLTYPIASYAKTEPDYYQGSHRLPRGNGTECNWRGPTWAPTNVMAFHGLVRYGFQDTARELASRLFTMALVKNPALREYYNAETGEGLGQTQFWGFTALYYGILLESYRNYDCTALEGDSQPIFTQELGLAFPGPAPA
jgi:putative isomerase